MGKSLTMRPSILIAGNHEWSGNFNFLLARYWYPLSNTMEDNNVFYFVIKNSLYFVFNSDYYLTNDEITRKNIRKKIDNVMIQAENFGIKFKFFLNHRPFLCAYLYSTNECITSLFYLKEIEERI